MISTPKRANRVDVAIGLNVRALRLASDKSLLECAAAIGIDQRAFKLREEGADRFGAAELFDLSRFLGINLSEFFKNI